MTAINFEKYHGTGNDFIVIDNRFGAVSDKESFATKFCDRHFGVGADGVIFLEKSDVAHFKMDFLNPDGTRSFCGNGSRCAVMFVARATGQSGVCTFEAIDGIHTGLVVNELVSIGMKSTLLPELIEQGWQLSTGSPHLVIFVDDTDGVDVKSRGAYFRYLPDFSPEGTNVNFVKLTSTGIDMRTYERGVEDETLSCGTGVTAAALCASTAIGLSSPIEVMTKGGLLSVSFERNETGFDNIQLSGPAKLVFRGTVEI